MIKKCETCSSGKYVHFMRTLRFTLTGPVKDTSPLLIHTVREMEYSDWLSLGCISPGVWNRELAYWNHVDTTVRS